MFINWEISPKKNYGLISYIHILSTEFSGTALTSMRHCLFFSSQFGDEIYLKWKIGFFPKSLGKIFESSLTKKSDAILHLSGWISIS